MQLEGNWGGCSRLDERRARVYARQFKECNNCNIVIKNYPNGKHKIKQVKNLILFTEIVYGIKELTHTPCQP